MDGCTNRNVESETTSQELAMGLLSLVELGPKCVAGFRADASKRLGEDVAEVACRLMDNVEREVRRRGTEALRRSLAPQETIPISEYISLLDQAAVKLADAWPGEEHAQFRDMTLGFFLGFQRIAGLRHLIGMEVELLREASAWFMRGYIGVCMEENIGGKLCKMYAFSGLSPEQSN